MPRIATSDTELLDEVDALLEDIGNLLQQPAIETLIRVNDRIDLAVSALSDVTDLTQPRWEELQQRVNHALDAWETTCRQADIRRELLTLLAPPPGTPHSPTVWAFWGYEAKPLGAIALTAFSPTWPTPGSSRSVGMRHCLWGPQWLMDALLTHEIIRVSELNAFPATHAEAETAATLWDPHNHESAYRDMRDAVHAARAILTS